MSACLALLNSELVAVSVSPRMAAICGLGKPSMSFIVSIVCHRCGSWLRAIRMRCSSSFCSIVACGSFVSAVRERRMLPGSSSKGVCMACRRRRVCRALRQQLRRMRRNKGSTSQFMSTRSRQRHSESSASCTASSASSSLWRMARASLSSCGRCRVAMDVNSVACIYTKVQSARQIVTRIVVKVS